jgi:hypothetical protein
MQRFPMFLASASALVLSVASMGCNGTDPISSADVRNDAQSIAKSSADEGALSPGAAGTISAEEREDLLFMREEEKVARDIYIMMYQRWGSRVFDNISKSEGTHMAAILTLLNRYGISDPVGANEVGVFTNEHLQEMYTQLLARGNESLAEAIQVGISIEVTDIVDLEMAIDRADNRDLDRVYSNLLAGSQNHLSAFTRVSSTN